MKTKIGLAIGLGMGTTIYEAIRHGIGEIDWTKVVFITLVSALVLLFIPTRVFEKRRAEDDASK
jgi:hypothetical protein